MMMILTSKVHLIVPAAGSGTRMGGIVKQYRSLGGGTVLSSSVSAVLRAITVQTVCIVYRGSVSSAEKALYLEKSLLSEVDVLFVHGGETRQQSVYNALSVLRDRSVNDDDIVMIHDAARPFVDGRTVQDVLCAALKNGAATAGIPATDTMASISKDISGANSTNILSHVPRSSLYALQTPQAFRFGALFCAHKKAVENGKSYTDDSEVYDANNERKTVIVMGDTNNKKITFPSDLPLLPSIRVGFGHDSHALVSGRGLMLGGVAIPYYKGEAGHSDGDALLHAVIDSLLGATHMGDIGDLFSPADDKWRGAHSLDLLSKVWCTIHGNGWNVVNMDCVVRLERPSLRAYKLDIAHSIATVLGVSDDAIAVSAKTGEGMDSVGRGEAVEAWVVCLLNRLA